MSLRVENGEGNPQSNSYVALLETDEYHAEMGNTDWIVTEEEENIEAREVALKKATFYLEAKYSGRWRGIKSSSDQSLAWPRWGAYDENEYLLEGVPSRVKKATMETALRIFSGTDLLPDSDSRREVIQETVGPISITYSPSGSYGSTLPVLPTVEMILSGCVAPRGVWMVRG